MGEVVDTAGACRWFEVEALCAKPMRVHGHAMPAVEHTAAGFLHRTMLRSESSAFRAAMLWSRISVDGSAVVRVVGISDAGRRRAEVGRVRLTYEVGAEVPASVHCLA